MEVVTVRRSRTWWLVVGYLLVLGGTGFLAQSAALTGAWNFSGEEDFLLLPGVEGEGTATVPYMIFGLEFAAQEQTYSVVIDGTDTYVVFKECRFANAKGAGLLLRDVKHVWFVECEFSGNGVGVEIQGSCEDVVFTLCSFKGNKVHVSGTGAGVSWDDGIVGNWWEGYAGEDANGDGIGDEPFEVAEAVVDLHPLAAPFAPHKSPGEGYVLLQTRLHMGESHEYVLHGEVETTVEMLGIPMVSTVKAQQRILEEVIGDRGGMVYTLRETILEDEGTILSLGAEQPYESQEGQISVSTLHRFGLYQGEGSSQEMAPPMPVSFPVRWIKPGDTWTLKEEVGAEELGLSGGFADFSGSLTLRGFETRAGRQCAVLYGEMTLSGKGREEDPLVGTLEAVVQGTMTGTRWIDLATGQEVASQVEFDIQMPLYMEGLYVGKMIITGHGESTISEAEELAPCECISPQELEQLRHQYETELQALREEIAALKEALTQEQIRIAYVDAEGLFLKVFLPQVEAERQAMSEKQQEIRQLQAQYLQGEIDQDRYQQQSAKLQVELLKAQLTVDLTMLDKMITSPGFANFKGDLQRIKDQAQPLVEEVDNLLQTAEVGIVDMEGFLAQYQQLQSAFQQLDQLLTQAAAAKIVEIAQQVAREKGFDLVLRKKDVLIYYNSGTVSDISGDVEGRLWNLFQ